MEIRMEESDALADHNFALHKMNELDGEIEDAEKDLKASEEDLKEAQASLEERAAQIYKSGNVAFIDVLVGVDDFSEFAARLDLWMRLSAGARRLRVGACGQGGSGGAQERARDRARTPG